MGGLRVVTAGEVSLLAPCCRCQAAGCHWDRIADKPYCPDCQEALALGEAEPLIEPVEPRRCAACNHSGAVRFLTFPLHAPAPVEIDLCPGHCRALLGRRLDKAAFREIGRQLTSLGLHSDQVFLLHEAFYDRQGRPLQPVPAP